MTLHLTLAPPPSPRTQRVEDVSVFGRKRSRVALADDGDGDGDGEEDDEAWVPGGARRPKAKGATKAKKAADEAVLAERARKQQEKEAAKAQREEVCVAGKNGVGCGVGGGTAWEASPTPSRTCPTVRSPPPPLSRAS
jgi:hypothetical protein